MNIPNTSWSFKLDHVHTYAFVENFLTKEECEYLIKTGKKQSLKDATVFIGNKQLGKSSVRESNVSWIYPDDDTNWLFRKLVDSITALNSQYFKFDLTGFNEGLQFTNYIAPSGHYGAHIDSCFNTAIRKLSLTIQLSDPSDYEGGDLKLVTGSEPFVAKKTQGMLYAFPSYVLHEVTSVTKGERNSLVGWITGPNFK